MKKIAMLAFVLILSMTGAVACADKTDNNDNNNNNNNNVTTDSAIDTPTAKWKDGTYTGEVSAADEKGWKEMATVTISGDKITSVQLNSVNTDTAKGNKLDLSKSGEYKMVEQGGAMAPWHDQVKALEDYVVANQGLDVTTNAEGKTDAISGTTISVTGFEQAIDNALSKAK